MRGKQKKKPNMRYLARNITDLMSTEINTYNKLGEDKYVELQVNKELMRGMSHHNAIRNASIMKNSVIKEIKKREYLKNRNFIKNKTKVI